jgi:hypothetical protein
MADVYGAIGDQPVELNNAATEATLKALLATMTAMMNSQSKNTKKDKKIQTDLEAELRRLAKASKDSTSARQKETDAVKGNTEEQTKNTAAQKKAAAAQKKYIEELEDSIVILEKLANGLEQAVTGLSSIMTSFSTMGNSVTAAAATLNHIPIAGRLLSSVFGAVAQAADRSMTAFQKSASVGANFGGSITDMIDSATGAGLTFDAFSGIIAKNGESVALLGQGSADGAKRLGELGKQIRKSGVADELYRMGYSTEDINNGLATFGGRLAKGGALQKMTTEQIASVTGNYLKELNAVATLTGQSKEALQEQENARMADAQYLNLKNKLDADGQKNLEILMASIPAGMQAGAKEVLATGTATTEAGQQFLVFMKNSGRSLQSLGKTAERTGTITTDAVMQNANLIQSEGKALSKSSLGGVAAKFIPELNGIMVASNTLASRQTDLGTEIKGQITAAAERKKQEQELKDKGLDPASMEKFKQQIAATSNEFTKMLAGILPAMMGSFTLLADFTKTFLVPIFVYLAENIKTVVATMIALKVAQLAYKASLAIERAKVNQRGSSGLNPMHVTTDGKGGLGDGPDGPDKKGGKGAKGAKGLKAIGRVGGAVAAVTAVAGMAMELSDVSDQLKEGKISEDEAKQKKSEAVGGGVGGAAGGAGGALAGATIGTLVFPGVGTVIGGIIGGALGSMGGDFLGRKAAGKYAEPKSDVKGLGKVAAQFESGGNSGSVSTGHGDHGGKSYGSFQLSSKTGDVDKFLQKSGYANQFQGMQVGSAAFDAQWKKLAKEDNKFGEAQSAHAKTTHYDPQMAKLQNSGIDLSKKGFGVQEAVMSTANQYGANTETIIKALKGKDTNKMNDEEIINAIQDYKKENVKTNFKSSSEAVKAGVEKRINQEREALLAANKSGGVVVDGSVTAKKEDKPTTAVATAKTENTPKASDTQTALAKPKEAKELVKTTAGNTPTASAVQTALAKPKEAEAASSTGLAANPLEALKQGLAGTQQSSLGGPASPAGSQESPSVLLSNLNSKMEQLIQIQIGAKDTGEKQLRKTGNTDMFTNIAIA